jgi:hypothetical protein
MAYSVDTYSGARTFVVEDGTIDSSLDIKLIGKNYAGYGEVQNENFVHLLENFAGSSAPPRPLPGQIWYDTTVKKIKYYDSTVNKWKTAGGSESAPSAPSGLSEGDFWFDSINKQLYVYDGTTYILVGPQGVSGLGTTQMQSVTVRDTDNNPRAIVKALANGVTVFVISSTAFNLHPDFTTPGNPEFLSGFGIIKNGITLANTNNVNGITDSISNTIHWGTASSALGLVSNGQIFRKEDFVTLDDLNFDSQVKFSDEGFTVGDGDDLLIRIDTDGITPVIKNRSSSSLKFETSIGSPLILSGLNILPGQNNQTDIGASGLTFKNIYASAFYGSGANLTAINASSLTSGTVPAGRLTGSYTININGNATTATTATTSTRSDELKVGTVYRTATVDTASNGTANSIACRDIDGNLNAVLFQGTATAALFADLAEKYLCDKDYEVGTVVAVGGDAEVTACRRGDRAFGAVSANPAYMMNAGLEGGTYIALKGRVPIKVHGPVRKGDRLVACHDGCAGEVTQVIKNMPIRAGSFPDTFAVALETNDDPNVKLVEAIII